MEKKNTVLLTVIAIATLLVAVVGATFAYFSASQTNNAETTVEVTTAAADEFVASGAAVIDYDVLASDMQQTAGSNDFSVFKKADAEGEVKLSLKAGSGVATCTYNLYYTASENGAFNYATGNTESLKEFTVAGASSSSDVLAEVDLAGKTDKVKINDEKYSISNTAGSAVTEITWNFTSNFYNLAVDQGSNANKTFGGTIVIDDVVCTNSAQ